MAANEEVFVLDFLKHFVPVFVYSVYKTTEKVS